MELTSVLLGLTTSIGDASTGMANNGGISTTKLVLRPQLATFNVTNGHLKNLKVIKPIAWGWCLPGQNLHVEDHYVDAKPTNATRDDTISFPFNTPSILRDGFNLSGQNITIDGLVVYMHPSPSQATEIDTLQIHWV
ncbi:hypothetical protein H0H92_000384 [Tricholoma furcatifolium]|nr:hypothetical protein H0H92_000384 [Tricholoma furcatifolium]